jgi:peptide/nickel transport system substrate-binding protein
MTLAIIMTAALLAGCSSSSGTPAAEKQTTATESTAAAPADNGAGNGTAAIRESPMLTERETSGALPKLEDRLPEVPLVSKLGSADAKYGGELRLAFKGVTSSEYGWMNTARVLNQHGMGSTEEMPYANVVEKYTANSDYTEYTFNLRKGLKWSDGQPVTTEDVRFWWEDVINSKDITPSIDAMWTSNGKPMTLKIIDEYTFSCTFESSYLLFPWQLSLAWRGNTMFFLPSDYLKPMHKKYADPAKYKDELAKAGYAEADWGKYFTAYGWGPNGPNELTTAKTGCPVLTPYVIKDHPSPTVWIAERNPYYFEVDEQGRQLPYIDTIRIEQVSDTSMLTMKAMAGEIDYAREAMSTQDIPVLKENESKGNYRAIPLPQHSSVYFNLNFGYDADKGWADIANNRKFRQALNYAIDRNEILSNLYLDQGKVSYHVPSELNLDKANALLDEIGMSKKDGEGFRTRPDGNKFQIDFEYAKLGTEFSDFVEIIRQNWASIGIRVIPKEIDAGLWSQKYSANQIQVRMLWCDFPVCEGNPVMWDWSIPVRSSTKYQMYYNNSGQSGDAPVGDLLDIFKKTFELKNAKSVSEMSEKWKEVKQLLSDSCIWFVPVEDVVAPVVYSNRMGNVKEDGYMIVSNMDLTYAYIK